MSLLAKAKINKISLDLANYLFYIQGVQKSGKTTFFRDIVLEKNNGNAEAGLLLAIGKEKGYKALDNIQALEIETWADFTAIIKELISTKDTNGIKYVAIDTFDELIPLAEAQIIKMSVQQTGKPCKSFDASFGGFGRGRVELRKLVTEAISLLNKHFALFVIGHTKTKTVKEQGMTDEESYMVLSSNLNNDYHSIVAHKADVIATAVVEKTVDNNRVSSSETNLYFRNNGFIEAGSRFSNIVEKIPFNASNFIKAIEDAIKNSATTTKITDENFENLAAQEKAERELEVSKDIETDIKILNEEDVIEESVNKKEMLASIKNNFMKASSDIKLKAKEILSKAGATKLDETLSVEVLKELTELLA